MEITLKKVWEQQIEYNNNIRSVESPKDYEYWMKQYLLGAISEVDEILQEINWKMHRRGQPLNKHNLGRELADLTKYVFSLWEWSGFSSFDMLKLVKQKSEELEAKYTQEFREPIPPGTPVIITDIDGTLGDYRKAFYEWLRDAYEPDLPPDLSENMAMEISLGLPYTQYAKYKEEFEASGGYRNLETYKANTEVLTFAAHMGVYVIAYTARPADRYSRIWSDTWDWIVDNELENVIAELHIGSEERIQRACDLQAQDHPVALLDDSPGLALRAAHAGIRVYLHDQPYNRGVEHRYIHRCSDFQKSDLAAWVNVWKARLNHTKENKT